MSFSDGVLRNEEKAIYSLRELYSAYGYSQYKVGRFEEYDLYAHNKSFLVSENILSFTDTNGKLMALKPDVTLSIVKNISADGNSTHKLYYNENVYRTSAESHGFKEIMQTGLECVGTVDTVAESEVVLLAVKSLEKISDDYILDVSHMGLVEGLLDAAGLEGADRDAVLGYIKSKNVTSIRRMSERSGLYKSVFDVICDMTASYMPLNKALDRIKEIALGEKMQAAYGELVGICSVLDLYGMSERVFFDFSVVNDCNYYDGVIFKGFINGVPDSILSGGRYDRLLFKMGKSCGAIGFAVYLDRLERFGTDEKKYDTDVLLVYDESSDAVTVTAAVRSLIESGKSVMTARAADKSVRYRELAKIVNGGIEILEAND